MGTRTNVTRGISVAVLIVLGACGRTASTESAPTTTTAATPATAAPVQTTTAPAAALPTYVVQSGDSLSVIAERFGISATALADANGIDDLDTLQVGQELKIPPATEVAGTVQTSD